MKTVLVIEMEDGSVWEADALPIAENRADAYAGDESRGSHEWLVKVDYALADNDELTDWAKNNMQWEDLKAVMVTPPQGSDYETMFCNLSSTHLAQKD